MVLFVHQSLLHEETRGRILFAEVVDYLAVGLNRNTFSHKVFTDHVGQGSPLAIVAVARLGNHERIHLGLAAELPNTPGESVRVLLLLFGMLEELGSYGSRMNARGHEVVKFVA